jgi:hypothetical protein
MRRFLDWLDSRFPAKIVVKEADYFALHEKLGFLGMAVKQLSDVRDAGSAYEINTRQMAKLHEERLDKLEASVQGIKDLLTKTPRQSDVERRAEYIASGRFPA